MKRILVVEPYYGGSHKNFLDGLCRFINADFTLLTLPARKWKMRMQLSAPWFVDCLRKMEDRRFDAVLCSTFVDVAVLKALLRSQKWWNPACRFCVYFHENQFVYPNQVNDPSRFQFSAINFNTALAADRLAFNSRYNLMTFLASSRSYVTKAADMNLLDYLVSIERKSRVLHPGIDFSQVDSVESRADKKIPVICWNHRWEHDKGPDAFFEALAELKHEGRTFRLVVLGQAFERVPDVFSRAQKYFRSEIDHFGYASGRSEYYAHLKNCDIVVSTALHEFFGISVLEAVRAGCIPVVPRRLSYPELYSDEYLYDDGELIGTLKKRLHQVHSEETIQLPETDPYSWQSLAPNYEEWLLRG